MIGKIILAIFLIGAITFGAIWFLTDQSPTDFIKHLLGPSENDVTSDNTDKFLYTFDLKLGAPYNSDNIYTVQFNIVRRTSDTTCYTYTITSIKQGRQDLIRGYTKGLYGVGENTVMCTPKDMDDKDFLPIYPFVGAGTSVSGSKSGSDYKYTYKYEWGVLRSFDMDTVIQSGNTQIPAHLTITFKGPVGKQTQTTSSNTATTQTTSKTATTTSSGGGEYLTSLNVSWVKYRFLWEIPVQDVVTGEVTQTKEYEYYVRVDVVNRVDNPSNNMEEACIQYTITDIVKGDRNEIVSTMTDFLGYAPGTTQCIDLTQPPQPSGIRFFLFNPQFSGMDIPISGDGISGSFSARNGIFYSLILFMENQILENGTVTSAANTTLRVNLEGMG